MVAFGHRWPSPMEGSRAAGGPLPDTLLFISISGLKVYQALSARAALGCPPHPSRSRCNPPALRTFLSHAFLALVPPPPDGLRSGCSPSCGSTVIAFASPASGGALGVLALPSSPSAPHGVPGAHSLELAHSPPPALHVAPTALPGNNPSGQPIVNGALIANTHLLDQGSQGLPWGTVSSTSAVSGTSVTGPTSAASSGPAPAASPTQASIVDTDRQRDRHGRAMGLRERAPRCGDPRVQRLRHGQLPVQDLLPSRQQHDRVVQCHGPRSVPTTCSSCYRIT